MRLQQLYTSATLQNDGDLAISGKVTRLGSTTGELPTPDDGQVRFQSLTLEAPDSTLRRSGGQRVVLASISYEDVQLRLFEDGALVGKFSLGPFSEVFFPEVFE